MSSKINKTKPSLWIRLIHAVSYVGLHFVSFLLHYLVLLSPRNDSSKGYFRGPEQEHGPWVAPSPRPRIQW